MTLSELSINRPVLATVLVLIIIIFGVIGYTSLAVREYPNVDNPIITVSVGYPGANAEVIENQITEPLEQNINGIPGIRSLMSLFALAVFYGYFLERTTSRRVLLALAAIPIAVAANVVRIVGTGLCVQYWDPDKALGFFHEFSGWVMFVISLCCLYLVHRVMRLVWPPTGEKA